MPGLTSGAKPRPQIVVGIDVGQTCSGVAYSIGPDWSEPKVINRWPGYHGVERADKVATRVGYRKGTNVVKNWGFESTFGDESIDLREQFKLTLDAEYEDDRGFSCQDARRWYLDYLRCLHGEIKRFFDEQVPRWESMHIEYNFSVPTTWKNPAMIASMEKLIETAGFGGTPRQSVRMSLTEAEAAAIEAATTQYQVGDIFLICDAGGGTTDVNLLKVMSTKQKIELNPLDHVEGVPIGSTLIDFRMAEYIVERLKLIEEHLEGDLYCLAEEMLSGRFQIVKHSFPKPMVPHFTLEVKGLAGSHAFEQAGIKNSKMHIDREVLTEIFDQQLEQIYGLIDDRFLALEAEMPNERVSYVIMSGGLGSSQYLFEKMKDRYELNMGFSSKTTARTRIMRVLEPQLAVVRGLVRERTQQLGVDTKIGQEVFTARRCRNSYGIIVNVPFDETKHAGLPKTWNPNTNRFYVPNCIEWFIRQGQALDTTLGARQNYSITLSEEEHKNPRTARIVMSSLAAKSLPTRYPHAGCKEVARVQYTLTENDMKLKNRQMWKLKKKYWRAEFAFVVNLGPADLKFQIIGTNGLLSSDHDALTIEFMDPSEQLPSPASPSNGRRSMPTQKSPTARQTGARYA
ncbi:hypothetical protein CB0940_02019 [Cercospora beticola]|uniref:Uncharacterized protein n=3 Tax=Cercospora beticola TaxID=122368 RepID=A0A2G5IAA6_CERBT|nr:hypothetical protein CB0940_02019 [Cercospora beticola]PIB01699.1 hypothetical protein CB0940_02019 [Cercospora beticola]